MINKNSLEAKILQYLMSNYPVTLKQLQAGLNLKDNTLFLRIKSLEAKGFIRLEPAGPDTFVRLLRRDFDFVEKRRQHRTLSKKKPKYSKPEFDDRIYG